MDKVVVSIGGSVLVPGDDDAAYIRRLADMLREVASEAQVAVVVGGGREARRYVDMGRALGGSVRELDELGIGITRVNARLLTVALGDMANTEIPVKADDCARMSEPGRIAVMGGTEPGHTTDAVSAMIAERMGADRIVNASNVDAVYSADPRADPDAVRYERMTIAQLKEVVYQDHDAGKSSVFDPLGVSIAMRERIDILMVNGRDLEELRNAILGKPIKGTFVDSHV